MKRRILDITLYRTYAELKSEAKRTYIGVLWWIFEPVLFMLIFYFVFAVLFQRGTKDFVPFLLVGLTAWQWFQSTVMQSSRAITVNRGLIQQVFVPKFVFPTVVILANTTKFLAVFVVLTVFLSIYGISPSLMWINAIPVLATILLFIAGISLLVSSVTPLLPDIRIVLENGLRAVFFLSGIFYDINTLPERYASWLRWNPIAMLITDLRSVLMQSEAPRWGSVSAIAALSIALIILGLTVLHRNESLYAKTTL